MRGAEGDVIPDKGAPDLQLADESPVKIAPLLNSTKSEGRLTRMIGHHLRVTYLCFGFSVDSERPHPAPKVLRAWRAPFRSTPLTTILEFIKSN